VALIVDWDGLPGWCDIYWFFHRWLHLCTGCWSLYAEHDLSYKPERLELQNIFGFFLSGNGTRNYCFCCNILYAVTNCHGRGRSRLQASDQRQRLFVVICRHIPGYSLKLGRDHFFPRPFTLPGFLYRHSPTDAVVAFRQFWRKSNFAQLAVEYIRGSAIDIQTPAQWYFLGRNMTAPQPVLSPSNILTSPSSHCAFISARKNLAHV
jgi:hypothetical protein